MALRAAQWLAIDLDAVHFGIGLGTERGHGLPVHRDQAAVMSSSALRREAIPAAAMIFWRRSAAMGGSGVAVRSSLFAVRVPETAAADSSLTYGRGANPGLERVTKRVRPRPQKVGVHSGWQLETDN